MIGICMCINILLITSLVSYIVGVCPKVCPCLHLVSVITYLTSQPRCVPVWRGEGGGECGETVGGVLSVSCAD